MTARLIVGRVRDLAKTDEPFPVWRHHPFFTNCVKPTRGTDIAHRRHGIIETRLWQQVSTPGSSPPAPA